ncbi:MAG TPA: monovalent cation:proton antiporter-2 (CPA2) family protein [Azospirillum sp.]
MPHSAFLFDALFLLLAAVILVPLLQRLRIPPVLGYLAAGVILGPYTPGPVVDLEDTRTLAEFGVVFLLFAIGLELPVTRLRAMRRYIFGLGFLQVLVTSVILGGAAWAAGLDTAAAVVVGGTLAFSSTATVLTMLAERSETVTRLGRIAVAVLIFQDLAVVPILALLPLLAGDSASIPAALALAGVKAVAAIAVIFLLGRFVVGPAYRYVAAARNPELFTAANLLLVLAVGWGTAEAGMSMALGAFLAGLLLADTAYRHQVEADIEPFRGLLLGLFFMTVGMSIDLPLVGAKAGSILALTFGLLAVKGLVLFGLTLAFGMALPAALRVALLLGQGGEFAFVVFGKAMVLGVVDVEDGQTLLAVVALSMALTPPLAALGRHVAKRVERQWGLERFPVETSDLKRHVVIAGYGRVGRAVARVLSAHDIPWVALDLDPQRVSRARDRGMPVYYGDASQEGVLRAAGIGRAHAAAITLNRPRMAEKAVECIRRTAPDLPIIARAHDLSQRRVLEKGGASAVVPETMEASLQIAGLMLRAAGMTAEGVDQYLVDVRQNNYEALVDGTSHDVHPR